MLSKNGAVLPDAPRLVEAYRHGKRVEITYAWGVKVRGRISASCGPSPTFIILRTRRSIGGHAVSEGDIADIRVVEK